VSTTGWIVGHSCKAEGAPGAWQHRNCAADGVLESFRLTADSGSHQASPTHLSPPTFVRVRQNAD